MTEYDRRQYRLMLENITEPIMNMRALLNALNRLQALVSVLEQKEQSWLSSFMEQWWLLEELYASLDAQGIRELDARASARIEGARQELVKLIESKLAQMPPSEADTEL